MVTLVYYNGHLLNTCHIQKIFKKELFSNNNCCILEQSVLYFGEVILCSSEEILVLHSNGVGFLELLIV